MKAAVQLLKHSAATLLGLGLVTVPAHATVLVTPTTNANTLAQTILGPGVTINSATYKGAQLASGTFTSGLSAGIGIDSGIIMTTGEATDAAGPNILDYTTTSNGTAGDDDLNNLVVPDTYDAASLVIDFTTNTSGLFFNYVFASEEYNEFVGSSFNDVFGFLLDGTNIALVPGTNTPVSINNVNGGNPFGNPQNTSNPAFYTNNDPNDPAATNDIEYDGFTKVLTAQDPNLPAGDHIIKLAIADTADRSLDSAVFIQAGSFADTPVSPGGDPVTPTPVPFEFSSTLGIWALGACGAMAQLNSKLRKRKSSKVDFLTTKAGQAESV